MLHVQLNFNLLTDYNIIDLFSDSKSKLTSYFNPMNQKRSFEVNNPLRQSYQHAPLEPPPLKSKSEDANSRRNIRNYKRNIDVK